MISPEGKVALKCFVITGLLFSILFMPPLDINSHFVYDYNKFISPILYYLAVNILIRIIFCKAYQVAVRATFLGFIFGLGSYVFRLAPTNINSFGLYMSVMAFFHYSEYLTISIIKPQELTTKSFMLTHSPQYIAAAVASWIEFALESYFIPELKIIPYFPITGMVLCLMGELTRKVAMFTAASNFDHLVRNTRAEDHILVTHGIYSKFRHPSYVGWFYWSIGTQFILSNPVCIIIYTIASWMFFNERIYCEEITLLNFFGQAYADYQAKVDTGLPFISGYIARP